MSRFVSNTNAPPPRRLHGRGRLGLERASLVAMLALAAMLGVSPSPIGAATASATPAASSGTSAFLGCVVLAYVTGRPPDLYQALVVCVRKLVEENPIAI